MADAEEMVIRAPMRGGPCRADRAARTCRGCGTGTLRLPFTGEEFVRERFMRTDGNVQNLVALVGGEVVGQAALIRGSGRLGHSADVFVAVHDDRWGRGIGRRLMLALIELADDWLGLVRLQLSGRRRQRAGHPALREPRLRAGGDAAGVGAARGRAGRCADDGAAAAAAGACAG